MNLTEICVRKPVLAWMLLAATVVFGGVAIARIGVSQFPDVDAPTISVNARWEGASPEVIENDVVTLLEEALVQVEGVRSLRSNCEVGQARITVELELSRDVDLALQDVQAKVAAVQRRLPSDVDPPTISKSNPEDQPILMISLAGPFPERVLSDYLQYTVKDKLQTIPGVGEIAAMGMQTRNVRLWLDATRLAEYDCTVQDITQALANEHVELPAGSLEAAGRETTIRVLGEALDLDGLRRLIIKYNAGSPVRLSDVCLVEDGFADVSRRARVDGVPAQALGIKKQRGANAVAVATAAQAVLADLQKTLPAGMTLGTIFDSTGFIRESVHEIELELILSVLLTALVCRLFLGSFSSTMSVILAIPMSLLGTIAIIYFLGFTFNTFTLLALALAVGIVVDDAIMVMENIYRHREMGKDLVTAALAGTREITFAALAATLAVVAIFIPVVFMQGTIGAFFLQFGVTLCLCVLISYVEAVTLAPAQCAQFLTTSAGTGRIDRAVDRMFRRLESLYGIALHHALRLPRLILLLATLLFAGALVVLNLLPGEFVPSQDLSRMSISLQTAVGSDLTETDSIVRQAEAVLARRPEVAQVFCWAGTDGGNMFVSLVPAGRRMGQQALSAELRRELNAIPGLRASIRDISQQGFTAQRGTPVNFSLRGSDWPQLIALSQQFVDQMTASGIMVDVESDYLLGMPELRVVPDRAAAADLGVSVDDIATTLNTMIGGAKVGKFNSGGRRLDVRLQLLAGQRARPEDIGRLRVRSAGGALVPLSSLVTWREEAALQEIIRADRERAITIIANIVLGYA
ncbi:MAG TPA: efflux RND transporter permease subunit, partial [bacterium]|nr:efflux RND transporter permease subunit [bacterium]